MCIFMVINIFSPLTNHQSGDYQSCSCRDRKNAVMISDHAFPWRDIKVAIMFDDRISSCPLRNHTSETGFWAIARMTNCSWYKDIEYCQRVFPEMTFSDERPANTYLEYMVESECSWSHRGVCVCNLQI